MSAQLFQFPVAAISTFDEAWKVLPVSMKTRSDSRRKLAMLWNDHAPRAGGQDRLLFALKAYLKGDKDLPKSGGPGLQVWLRAERYDHWLDEGSSVTAPIAEDDGRPRFPGPFRDRLIESCGEGWVLSYLDQCALEGTVVVVPAGRKTAFARLGEKAAQMKAAGLTARRMERVDDPA